MPEHFSPYALPLFLSTGISLLLALFAFQRRHTSGALAFMALMLLVAEFSLTYALELNSVDLAIKVLWANLEYVGIASVSVAWFVFALQYTERGAWLTPRNLILLFTIPLVTVLLLWTNDWHNLMRSDVRLSTDGALTYIAKTYGAWFWVHTAYSYLMNFLGSGLLIQRALWGPRLYRAQAIAILLGVATPWLGNLIYLFGLSPVRNLDLTPLAFTLSGVAMGGAIFRFRLFNLVPLARDAVIESMSDGVIVLDMEDRAVDINPAALRMLGLTTAQVIAQPAAQFFPAWGDLLGRYHHTLDIHEEIVPKIGGPRRIFDVHLSPLFDRRRQFIGRLVAVCEISERKAQEELRRTTVELQAVVHAFPDLYFRVDADGTILDYHALRAADLYDLPGQLLQEKVQDVLPPNVGSQIYQGILQVVTTNAPVTVEYSLPTPDGERSYETRLLPLHESQVFVIVRDITERKQAEEKLRYLSTHDGLTGLYNRTFFEEEMARLERSRQFPISVVMADIDGLKETNDSAGHAAGDVLLRRGAQVLTSTFRGEDIIARIGGDEFAVLLPNTNATHAEEALRRIRDQLAKQNIQPGGILLSISMGTSTAEKAGTLSQTLTQADAQMYAEKSKRAKRL